MDLGRLSSVLQRGEQSVPSILENQSLDRITVTTMRIIQNVFCFIWNRKAPGPIGLQAELLKATAHPHLLLQMYYSCLKEGKIPTYGRLTGLYWSEKAREHRMQHLLIDYFAWWIRLVNSWKSCCDRGFRKQYEQRETFPQYGFRTGRSTINAVQEVVDAAKTREIGNLTPVPCAYSLL